MIYNKYGYFQIDINKQYSFAEVVENGNIVAEIDISVFEKDKQIEVNGVTLKPFGYIRNNKDIDKFKILTDLIMTTPENRLFGLGARLEEVYREAGKKGCKRTDFFVVVDSPYKGLKGRVVIPSDVLLCFVSNENIIVG